MLKTTSRRLGVDAESSAPGSIEVQSVSKVFPTRKPGHGAGVQALSSINLSVAPGEFVSIVGPSGCGKSTLLMMVGGLLDPTEGEICVDGTPLAGPRREIGVMFQTPELFPWRTVMENVLLPVDVLRLPREMYIQRARGLLAMAGLEGFESAYPHELSGGMEQRTALCRVLVDDPQIILMDEPFGALDEFTRERLNVELLRIWDSSNRKTLMFVTHNIAEAVFLSDRVVVMGTNPGQVLRSVTIDLPRPRSFDVMRLPQYGERILEIRDALGVMR